MFASTHQMTCFWSEPAPTSAEGPAASRTIVINGTSDAKLRRAIASRAASSRGNGAVPTILSRYTFLNWKSGWSLESAKALNEKSDLKIYHGSVSQRCYASFTSYSRRAASLHAARQV
ncbi:TetR family transcriptional regulator [Bradyrhizobium oligotrophicum S58]|uniref:TetR family transcriptional regulator n=1 Tax=Bradyrhizobium oligotrophicum S58 TaxID=1245469 RepID=M4Z4U5_9BRAD|nr:TetR family transcriptional regulator [Bradyrhizobium oligotrophicum S58]